MGKIDGDGIFSEVVNTEDYFTDDESIAQWVHWFCEKQERKE